MTMEYTGVSRETVKAEFEKFLDANPEDTLFKLVINPRRGYLKVQARKKRKGRVRRLLSKLKRRR